MKNELTKLPTFKKLILDELKEKNLEVIAKKIKSVRYETFSMGSAVNVRSVDLTKKQRGILESLLNGYKSGYFDSMQDLYVFQGSTKARSAKYVSLSNEFSPEVKERVKRELEKEGIVDYQTAQEKYWCDYETIIWRKLVDLEDI